MEFLNRMGQLAVTGDVAHRAQPSDFERIGVPIISAALSTAANAVLSDRRARTDIRPTGVALAGGIPIVTLRYRGTGTTRIGVVAQDVQCVLSEAVATGRGGLKYVNYTQLVAAAAAYQRSRRGAVGRCQFGRRRPRPVGGHLAHGARAGRSAAGEHLATHGRGGSAS
jgi:hypothetical protein